MNEEHSGDVSLEIEEYSSPRYDLSPDEMDGLERGLVSLVREKVGDNVITALWISPRSPYANFLRMHEASYFPEVKEITAAEEEKTVFLALVDTRASAGRVVHGATITGLQLNDSSSELENVINRDGASTDFYTVDSLIERGNFTVTEFRNFYLQKGVDLNTCISVETNFRVGEKVEPYGNLGTADIAYLALFKLVENLGAEQEKSVVFATINSKQIDSFKRVGLKYELLMDRSDLSTEESELGVDSLPVAIYYNAHAKQLLGTINISLPQLMIPG